MQPEPCSLRWLTGEWSITRSVNGDEGDFSGVAVFEPIDGGLRWSEDGTFSLGRHKGPARRELVLIGADEGPWQVRFDDGRPFHPLDLRSGRCIVEHGCGDDVYRGTYDAGPGGRLQVDWRVLGPGRDDTIRSSYVARTEGGA